MRTKRGSQKKRKRRPEKEKNSTNKRKNPQRMLNEETRAAGARG